jgi:fibronectin type III domain protein
MTAPTALPYGMRDLKLTRYTDAVGTVLGSTSVDLPYMQTLSWSETEEFQTLRGDDKVIAIRGQGALVEWELEAGGIDFAAWEILTGGTVILSGLTPNRTWTLRKRSTNYRPYFKVVGRALSESGGDMLAVIYRCRANDTIEGEFADGEFFVTSASGQGLPLINDDVNDLLYDMVLRETAATLSTTPTANPTIQDAPTNLAAGTATATTVPLTWTAATVGPPAATEYDVWFRTSFGDWTQVTAANLPSRSTTGATVNGLTTATQYQFKVRAVTAANGVSDFTAPVSKTTS